MREDEIPARLPHSAVEYRTQIAPYEELSLRTSSLHLSADDNLLNRDDAALTFHDGSVAEPVVYLLDHRIVSVSGSCLEYEGTRVIGQSCNPRQIRGILGNYSRHPLEHNPHDFTAVYPDLRLYVDENPHEGIWAWSAYYNGPYKTKIWLSLGGIDKTQEDISRTALISPRPPTGGRLYTGTPP